MINPGWHSRLVGMNTRGFLPLGELENVFLSLSLHCPETVTGEATGVVPFSSAQELPEQPDRQLAIKPASRSDGACACAIGRLAQCNIGVSFPGRKAPPKGR